jgi:hypothetical protein
MIPPLGFFIFSGVWIKKNPHALRGTLFSTHALRGIKNKKSGEYFKIRILKAPPRHLYPQSTGTEYPLVGC